MATLLIRPSEITEFTPMGGNVDEDKYLPCVFDVQVTVIEPLLGEALFDKVLEDFADNSLTGLYLELYNTYLTPILRHQVFAEYIEIGAYMVTNAGIFKNQPDNAVVAEKSEIQYFAQTHRSKAQLYIDRCKKWLKTSGIPEYKNDNCGGNNNVKVTGGWWI